MPDGAEHPAAAAGRAIRAGELVVYPTETVYGLGADALDPAAIERVYQAKGRPRAKPLSLGVPDVGSAIAYTDPDERTIAFLERFLPGPVTVVVPRGEQVPDALTSGRETVGVRVPAHELAAEIYRAADRPVTATSANLSGAPSRTRVADIDPGLCDRALVVEGGETAGTESTVVEPATGTIHRAGADVEAIREWLATH